MNFLATPRKIDNDSLNIRKDTMIGWQVGVANTDVESRFFAIIPYHDRMEMNRYFCYAGWVYRHSRRMQ